MAIGMEVAAADGTNEFEDELDAAAHLLAADHIVGPVHPRLLLLEYGDDECPSCAYAEPVTLHLIETFAKHLRFVFRHFPLVHVHPHAEMAAEAAEAAAVQDKFWAMHHALFTHSTRLTSAALDEYAESVGLDMQRFKADMAHRAYAKRVREDRRSGELIGLRGSPTFFLNGAFVDVSFGLDRLDTAVRAALRQA